MSLPQPFKVLVLKVLGFLFLALGFIGAFLPILPTTPFVLLALYCFNSSSPKMKIWILDHKIFGPPVKRWQESKTISLKIKVWAISVLTFSIFLSVFVLWDNKPLVVLLSIIYISLVVFLSKIKSKKD